MFFYYNDMFKGQTITSKKLRKENKIMQLVKPKTKHHPTLTSDKYTYGEVLHVIADICNTTFWKSYPTNIFRLIVFLLQKIGNTRKSNIA